MTPRRHGTLVCENIVLLTGDVEEHRGLMAWPHWALKHLYGPVGLMFGKFWKGEEGTDRRDVAFPRRPSRSSPCAAPSGLSIPGFWQIPRTSLCRSQQLWTTDARCFRGFRTSGRQ